MRILAPGGVRLYLKSFFTTPFSVHKKTQIRPINGTSLCSHTSSVHTKRASCAYRSFWYSSLRTYKPTPLQLLLQMICTHETIEFKEMAKIVKILVLSLAPGSADIKKPWPAKPWFICQWCGRQDSNLHTRRHQILNLACLPISPRPHAVMTSDLLPIVALSL